MPIPILKTIDQLKDALADPSMYVVEIAGRDYLFLMARDDNQAQPRAFVSPTLVGEAVNQGVLIESLDACSAYELAST